MNGKLEHIHIAPSAGSPMQSLLSVEAVAGVGLTGDRYSRREGFWKEDGDESRDVTLIEAEEIERLAAEAGIELGPGDSRRNLTTRGIRLNELVGKEFWIGEVKARGLKLCEPCSHLQKLSHEKVLPGLVHRGGLRAQILSEGTIRVGETVRESE